MDEAVYKCESTACLYPFRNFKYKNYVDRTIFRYERIMDASALDQKIFTSPTKIESDDMDNFNLSWLDASFNEDLDSILTTPSDGKTCDIKEIINNICSNGETTSIALNSPTRLGSAQSLKAPAQKLSKCLQYIEHLSPAELSHSNKVETMPSTSRIAQECTLNVSTANNNVLKSTSKSLKKIRNGSKKNAEIKQTTGSHTVEQKPLGFLDWLDVVSRIEPKHMNEFEFASPTQLSESLDQSTNNTENSSDPSYTQPVLIELLRPPASLDGNQVSNNGEPCLLYQLDPRVLQTTQKQCESMSNAHIENSITTQTSEIRDQILVGPVAPNVEHSSSVSGESFSTDFQIIKTKIGTGSSRSEHGHGANKTAKKQRPNAKARNKNNPDAIDAKLKKKIETKKIEKIKRKREEKKKRNKVENIGKSCNAELEGFHGFEPLAPFQPVTLERKRLVWLKVE